MDGFTRFAVMTCSFRRLMMDSPISSSGTKERRLQSVMNVNVREIGGMYVADVRSDANSEVLYATDPAADAECALRLGQEWAAWFDGLSAGRIESIYYILAIPETWPGPTPGSHPYSGLHFKIGRAKDVRKRVLNLSTGTSSKLIVHVLEPGSAILEPSRHRQF